MKATNAPPLPTNVVLELTPDEAKMLLRIAQLNITIPNAMHSQFMDGKILGYRAVEDFLDDLSRALCPVTKEPKQ